MKLNIICSYIFLLLSLKNGLHAQADPISEVHISSTTDSANVTQTESILMTTTVSSNDMDMKSNDTASSFVDGNILNNGSLTSGDDEADSSSSTAGTDIFLYTLTATLFLLIGLGTVAFFFHRRYSTSMRIF